MKDGVDQKISALIDKLEGAPIEFAAIEFAKEDYRLQHNGVQISTSELLQLIEIKHVVSAFHKMSKDIQEDWLSRTRKQQHLPRAFRRRYKDFLVDLEVQDGDLKPATEKFFLFEDFVMYMAFRFPHPLCVNPVKVCTEALHNAGEAGIDIALLKAKDAERDQRKANQKVFSLARQQHEVNENHKLTHEKLNGLADLTAAIEHLELARTELLQRK